MTKNANEKNQSIVLRVITIGDSGVGKTAMIKRYIYNTFTPDSLSTIGINSSFRNIIVKDGTKVQLKLMDTAGQEKYRVMTKSYYKNSEGVLFVFAYDNKTSFDNIGYWIKTFKENNTNDQIPAYLIGNKSDLENKSVTQEDIDKLLKEYKLQKFESTSALINQNIEKVFQDMAEDMYNDYKKNASNSQATHKLLDYKEVKKKKKKNEINCCLRENN